MQYECTRHLGQEVSWTVGEARKQHKRQFLYCPLEVDCKFFWLTNLAKFNCHARSPLHHTGLVQRQMLFLEDLLAEMVAKNSKDPFGNIRVARKALSKIRCVPLIASSPFTVCHLFAWNLVKVAGSW